MKLYLPEWEIEEAIVRNLKLIKVPRVIEEIKLIERQKYLKDINGYIDLLFKTLNGKYVLVEIKCIKVDKKSVVTDQVLRYRSALSKQIGIPKEKILCMLVTSAGFSKEVKQLCDRLGVITKELNENEIISAIITTPNNLFNSLPKNEKEKCFHLLQQRKVALNSNIRIRKEIKSVQTWIKEKIHDNIAKSKIASLFKETSEKAPLCAHEVESNSNGKLTTNEDMWFWLFYSVMDRRTNAALFIKAKEFLDKHNLYSPKSIINVVKARGEKYAIRKITKILETSGFPLLEDSKYGNMAFPKSIVDAAKFMKKYNYDFNKLYEYHYEKNGGNLELTYKSLWNDIKSSIYGVGVRITAQFIRGMVLKGPWRLPLTDNKLLEKCKFNVRFAGPTRLALIRNENTYYEDLGKFADDYLNGNRAIISHTLWYIRKKFCDKQIKCDECLFAGYCRYYLLKLNFNFKCKQ